MDVSAHALRLFDLTNDAYMSELLGDLRFDRDALAMTCEKCPYLQWGRSP